MLISCRRYSELASIACDRELNWNERLSFRFHHVMCLFCRRFHRHLGHMNLACKNLCDGEGVPPESVDSSECLSAERVSKIKEALSENASE